MTKNMKGLIGFPFLAVLVASIANAQTPLNERDMAMTMSGEFTFASVGDLMMRRPASQLSDPEIQAVFELVRNADLSVGNMEGELANLREFEGPLNGFVGSHEVASDLKRIGIDMVNRAQNHLLDAEFEGMFSTNALHYAYRTESGGNVPLFAGSDGAGRVRRRCGQAIWRLPFKVAMRLACR